METVRASVEVIYNGHHAKADLTGGLMSFTYTDKTEGESDSISLTVDNSDLRWCGRWRPIKGDEIEAKIIDAYGNVLPCGKFTVDQPEYSGSGGDSGDICIIKGLAAGVKVPVRTKRSIAHENKTLREIATKIADRNGFTVVGITKDFKIRYEAQYHETDLAFLHRLSMKFGYVFNLRDKQLIFTRLYDLHELDANVVVLKSTIGSYTITDKITKIYKKGRLKKRNHRTNKVVSSSYEADNDSSDTLEVKERVDDDGQAEEVVKAKVYRENLDQITMNLNNVPGNVLLVAGNNVRHQGWKDYDGIYTIKESTHVVDGQGGYLVSYGSNYLKE